MLLPTLRQEQKHTETYCRGMQQKMQYRTTSIAMMLELQQKLAPHSSTCKDTMAIPTTSLLTVQTVAHRMRQKPQLLQLLA